MPNDKALDPNGITTDVFNYHWLIVKCSLMNVVLYYFKQKYVMWGLNHTHITLIPEKNGSTSLDDYKPNSCVRVAYKVFAKLMATRLLAVLP